MPARLQFAFKRGDGFRLGRIPPHRVDHRVVNAVVHGRHLAAAVYRSPSSRTAASPFLFFDAEFLANGCPCGFRQ